MTDEATDKHRRRCTCKIRKLKTGVEIVIEMCAKCTYEEANRTYEIPKKASE